MSGINLSSEPYKKFHLHISVNQFSM